MMIFSLVAMIGLEKCCITSACLQWLCHSGERTVARGPLVYAPAIFNGGGHIVSPLSIRPVPSLPYVTLLVSVRYLLKGLVYWIEILYTGT